MSIMKLQYYDDDNLGGMYSIDILGICFRIRKQNIKL